MRRLHEFHRPLIGITTDEIENINISEQSTQPGHITRCIKAVKLAGGEPVIIDIPADPRSNFGRQELRSRFNGLAGIIFTGGTDVDPGLYGEPARQETDPPSKRRDETELYLFELAEQSNKPVLAICRGLQLLNVYKGGSLVQHLEGKSGEIHKPPQSAILDWSHDVTVVDPDSLTAKILAEHLEGNRVAVNSSHHQAIDRLGKDLKIVARADDGLIEAVESIEPGRFAVGLQPHPESMGDAGRAFFAAHVEACHVQAMPRAA